ncbi:MAG: inositol monophosphatase family protein [Maricaulaceae bacterium]
MTEYNSATSELTKRLQLFPRLRTAARGISLPLFTSPQGIRNNTENKSTQDYDPVTSADIEAELKLREIIQDVFPDDHITGEEHQDIIGSNNFTWTLDPIDGTRAFVAGVPVWSTLIALSENDHPSLGMIDLPALDRTYMGAPNERGEKIAWVEEAEHKRPLKSAPCSALKHAIIGCTEPLAMFNAGELAAYNIIRHGTKFSRLGLDALGYGLLSEGRMNIIIESSLKPCDVRALIPVIEGAGGYITNWHGGSCVNGGQVVAVSDKALLEELYIYLGRAMSPS